MLDIEKLKTEYEPYVIRMRRYFHAHPELSGKELKTSAAIRAELDADGIEWRSCGKSLPQGTLGTIKGDLPGKTILLRSDIDALPITEATGLPFASENPGVMHACGHDNHIAMLLTAAKILAANRHELRGTVKVLFQPSEEVGIGALDMIEDGALEGVDAAFGMHVWPELASGRVSLEPGPRMASTDRFRIDIQGKGGHAAAPHLCVDATPAAAFLAVNLQTLVSRSISPASSAVLTIGSLHSGSRWNVTSGSAYLEGTVRCFDEETRKTIREGMKRMADRVAAAHGCTAETTYTWLSDAVINDPAITAVAAGAAAEVLGPDGLASVPPTLVGEDFAVIMHRVPSAFGFVGIRNEAVKAAFPLHTDRCTSDESGLIGGALIFVKTAYNFLNR